MTIDEIMRMAPVIPVLVLDGDEDWAALAETFVGGGLPVLGLVVLGDKFQLLAQYATSSVNVLHCQQRADEGCRTCDRRQRESRTCEEWADRRSCIAAFSGSIGASEQPFLTSPYLQYAG